MKQRLDQHLVARGLVRSRSQAESYIKLGQVTVGGKPVTKPGHLVSDESDIELLATEQYVSRAGLQHGAKKVIAVEVGTNQLHPSLQGNPQIELHERTDIRNFITEQQIDIVVADVSFISLREILPSVAKLCNKNTVIIAMVKPQFESATSNLKHKGVIKNDRMRRDILKDFEMWAAPNFVIVSKADSSVAGEKGNLERFYDLRIAKA
jgi:23S rRNA (cytidine1920-2'-O)/16S rRNA (cytidine1409-2'-O)-methyltransferase